MGHSYSEFSRNSTERSQGEFMKLQKIKGDSNDVDIIHLSLDKVSHLCLQNNEINYIIM